MEYICNRGPHFLVFFVGHQNYLFFLNNLKKYFSAEVVALETTVGRVFILIYFLNLHFFFMFHLRLLKNGIKYEILLLKIKVWKPKILIQQSFQERADFPKSKSGLSLYLPGQKEEEEKPKASTKN